MAVSGGMDDSIHTNGDFLISGIDIPGIKGREGTGASDIRLSVGSQFLMAYHFLYIGMVPVCISLADIALGFGDGYDLTIQRNQ